MRLRSEVYKSQNTDINEKDKKTEILVNMRKKSKMKKKKSYCSYIQNKIKQSILNSVKLSFNNK